MRRSSASNSNARVLFVCGREPDYVRNRLLIRGLERHFPVKVISSSQRDYASRFKSLAPRLVRAIREADVVVAGFLGQPLAIFAAAIARKPVLLDAFVSIYDTLCLDRRTASVTSPLGQIAFRIDRSALRSARATIVDTAAQREFFAATFEHPIERLIVHYLGPDFEMVNTPELQNRSAPITVLHYGSFLPLHGVDVVIDAANILRDDTSIQFRIIGAGSRYAAIRQQAASLKLSNVQFIDWLTTRDLSTEINSCTIGLGGHFAANPKARRVIAGKTFQLLVAGRPTIVGECPANRELFSAGDNVEEVPMANPVALAEAIRRLADDASYRETLSRRGAALMRDLFSAEKVAMSLRRAVERVIDTS